jgi:hypothetical protein
MTRHGLLAIYPAQTPWRGTAALVPDTIYSAAHNQHVGRPRRSRCVIRPKCRPSGSHGSPPTDDLTCPRNGADPKAPWPTA